MFRIERREGCIGLVQVREKRRIDRTGSGQREDFTPDQRDQPVKSGRFYFEEIQPFQEGRAKVISFQPIHPFIFPLQSL